MFLVLVVCEFLRTRYTATRMCSARFGSVQTCRFSFSVRFGSARPRVHPGSPWVDLGSTGIGFPGSLRGGAPQENWGGCGGSVAPPTPRIVNFGSVRLGLSLFSIGFRLGISRARPCCYDQSRRRVKAWSMKFRCKHSARLSPRTSR